MMTFSIYDGTIINSSTLDIMGATSVDFSNVLNGLHDNINKEIYPERLRNSVLTSFSTSAFKQTHLTQSNIYYIGVDNVNTDYSNKDVKNKILLGKRSYKFNDIMSLDLLSNDGDIFIYNTKKDTISNYRTRIVILSGTDSNIYNKSPYIQSQIVTNGTYSALSLDIIGPNDSIINFDSDSGTVSLNDIVLPTKSESYLDASDGRTLQWLDGNMVWGDITFSAIDYIGSTGSQLDIYGSTVDVNGYSLDFIDSDPCPINIGDIKIGETFNSVPISEMLRRIIYTYLPPQCSIEILPPYNLGFAEIGSSPVVRLQYTITKRSLPTLVTSLSYMIPSSYPPITNPGLNMVTGSASGFVVTPITSDITTFTITVSDGTQSSISSDSIVGVYPYFHGFSSLPVITPVGLASLTKLIEGKSDKYVDVYGSGNLYFIYDNDYMELSDIFDESGNTIFNSFTSSVVTLSSPIGIWASKQFKVYQWNGISQIGPPSINYYFKY